MDPCQQLLKDLEQLSLCQKCQVSPDDVDTDYVVDLTAQSSNTLLAAASSNFSIHLLSRDSLQKVSSFKGHKGTITKIQFCKSEPNLLYSSSKDKTLRCWDTRTSKQTQSFDIPQTINVELLSMDMSHSGRLLCAGTEKVKSDSYILFWDSRQKPVLGCYSECHEDDVTQLSFQPGSDQNFASGSSDGLVCTFDLSQTSEDDALQITSNAEADVGRIGWCGEGNTGVYAVTSDNSFYAWDAFEGDPLCSVESLSELQTEKKLSPVDYIMDCVPTLSTTGKTRSSAVLLAATYSGDLRMISLTEDAKPVTVCSLSGGHTDTIRCSYWDAQTKSLFTGAEDSFVCVWSIEHSLSAASSNGSGNKSEKVKGKVKKKTSISSSGKKPYERPKR